MVKFGGGRNSIGRDCYKGIGLSAPIFNPFASPRNDHTQLLLKVLIPFKLTILMQTPSLINLIKLRMVDTNTVILLNELPLMIEDSTVVN